MEEIHSDMQVCEQIKQLKEKFGDYLFNSTGGLRARL